MLSQAWRVPHQLLKCFLLAAKGLFQPCSRIVHVCGILVACAGRVAEVMGCPELMPHYAMQTLDTLATSTSIGVDPMAQVMGRGVHVPEALRCANMHRTAAGNQLEMRDTLRYRTGAERHMCPLTCGHLWTSGCCLPTPTYHAVQ